MPKRLWVLFAVMFWLLAGCSGNNTPGPSPSSPQAMPAEDVDGFLKGHWQRPPVPQGATPSAFTPLEVSLAPSACGNCHTQQYADWRTTLHSQAMSPGLIGQLRNMGPKASDEHETCLQCHAPLAEQALHLADNLATHPRPPPARADGISHEDGLTCAGCHVRRHERFGPPRRDGSQPTPGTPLPHGGWQARNAFSDSRFCASCHQFETDGPSLNGKPLENTFAEWQASRHSREGRQCQTCHMPDRRHLWRGIHDPDMVRSGIDIQTSAATIRNDQISLEITIANTNVGHAFPSYVTPHVIVEITQQDRQGQTIPETVAQHLIARDISLDLSTERTDTRLMPDEVRRYVYRRARHPGAVAIATRIMVEPDAFYVNFYRATLKDPTFRKGRTALQEALNRAEASPYELYRQQQTLPLRAPKSAK